MRELLFVHPGDDDYEEAIEDEIPDEKDESLFGTIRRFVNKSVAVLGIPYTHLIVSSDTAKKINALMPVMSVDDEPVDYHVVGDGSWLGGPIRLITYDEMYYDERERPQFHHSDLACPSYRSGGCAGLARIPDDLTRISAGSNACSPSFQRWITPGPSIAGLRGQLKTLHKPP